MARILLVEDEDTTRKVVTRHLERKGYEVILSPDGYHAIKTLRCNPGIDLVITDVIMPEMDGRRMIQALRGDEKLGGIPIIIISGLVAEGDVEDLLNIGATAFLNKPVDKNELYDHLDKYLEMENQR